MSILHILYYSGTGNTKRALGIVAGRLAAKGFAPAWHDLAEGLPALGDSASEDLFLVGFPALGFSAPEPVIRVLKALPRLGARRAAILCACGATWSRGKVVPGWAGTAVPEAVRILESKGLDILSSAEVSYPENWRQVSRPASGEAREALVAAGDAETLAFAEALEGAVEGKERPRLRRGPMARLLMPLVARLFRVFGRRALAKLFVADADCTGCGACARACPAKAISMEAGRPSWTTACSACNRCINACPAGAIQSSNLRFALVFVPNLAACCLAFPAAGALVAALGRAAGLDLPRLASGLLEAAGGIALYSAFTFLQVGPLDAVLRLLERRPASKKAFDRSFTKGFPRYLAPGFEAEARGGRKA